jgi:hypothetical protein
MGDPMIRFFVLGLFVSCLLTSPPAVAADEGEKLVIGFPEGWVLVLRDQTEELLRTEFMPKGQTAETWAEKFTVQVFNGLGDEPMPFLERALADHQKQCLETRAEPPQATTVNGYDSAVLLVACARERGTNKGTLTLIQAIGGEDSFYVLQRAWRGAPYPVDKMPIPRELFSQWVGHLNSASVCDPRDPKHPC